MKQEKKNFFSHSAPIASFLKHKEKKVHENHLFESKNIKPRQDPIFQVFLREYRKSSGNNKDFFQLEN